MQGDDYSYGPVKMWRVMKGENVFRFQSDHPIAIRRMRQRQDWNLFAWQVNGPLCIYDAHLHDLKSAKRTIKSLAKGLPYQDHSGKIKEEPAR